jgi:hypothetical protein
MSNSDNNAGNANPKPGWKLCREPINLHEKTSLVPSFFPVCVCVSVLCTVFVLTSYEVPVASSPLGYFMDNSNIIILLPEQFQHNSH